MPPRPHRHNGRPGRPRRTPESDRSNPGRCESGSVFEQGAGFGGGFAPEVVIGAGGAEQAISGGRAEREQGRSHRVGEGEMAMAFELGDEHRQKRDKTLGADGVGGQPGNDERLLDGRRERVGTARDSCGWVRSRIAYFRA